MSSDVYVDIGEPDWSEEQMLSDAKGTRIGHLGIMLYFRRNLLLELRWLAHLHPIVTRLVAITAARECESFEREHRDMLAMETDESFEAKYGYCKPHPGMPEGGPDDYPSPDRMRSLLLAHLGKRWAIRVD